MLRQLPAFSLWFLLFARCLTAQAQEESPSLTRFTMEQGLADDWVHTAMQDSKGFLWFGTEGGLSRFDGQHFLNFYEVKNDPASLSNNSVKAICEDPDGSFWLAVLDGGLNRFDPATGRATAWRTDLAQPWEDAKKPLSFTSMLQDGDLLWLGSYDHALGCFDKKLKKYIGWYDLPTDPLLNSPFQHNTINHIIADRQNPRFLWLAAANRGLARFDKQTKQLEIWPIWDIAGKGGVAAMSLFQDEAGLIWIGSWSAGVAVFDPKNPAQKIVTTPYDYPSWQQSNYNRNVVLSMLEKDDSLLWVATLDQGFGTFNKVSGKFNFYKNSLSGESPELDRACQGFFLDRQQRLWILGRQQGGLRVYAPKRQSMRYISLASGGGIAERSEVSSLAYSPSRRSIFIATENNGCFEWSDEKSSLKQLTKPMHEGSFPNFRVIFCDSKGNVWAGSGKTVGGKASLYRLKPGQSHFEVANLNLLPFGGLEETVNDIMEDSNGNLWIATSYNGIYKLNLNSMKVEYYFQGVGFAKDAPNFNWWWALLKVKEGPDGHIWFVMKNGEVLEFDPIARNFKTYNYDNILASNDVISLEFSADGQIWLGTKTHGLQTFSPGVTSKDSVRVVNSKDGLPSQYISDIKRDANGLLWLTTDKGLTTLDPNTLTFRNYGITDGLHSTVLKGKGLALVPSLGVLVGQPNGFCLLRNEVDKDHQDVSKMQVVLTDFKVFGQSKYFEKRVRAAVEVQLQPSENVFSFQFAVPTSLDASLISYEYRLDGFDENWYTADGANSITYTQLPPGPYTFRVRAVLAGQPSPETTLDIFIEPYWWQTWWTKAAGILSIGMLFFGAYLYRTRQLKRENELLRQMNDLERSALQAQMNPHFIFNCLSAIQNFILQNEKEQAMNYLGDFAQLVRGVLNASVMGKVSLQDEVQLLENYLSLEQLRFEKRFDYQIRLAEGLGNLKIAIPPLLIQPYVENAVLHGMAGRKNGGKVEVYFDKKENHLEVLVKDNGQGTMVNSLPKTHKSVGMTVTRRRLELLNSKSNSGAVEVHQPTDAEGKIAGTEVRIYIGFVTKNN